ncbi:MAG: DUF5677 domain-containing protein [Thermoguttaceae bacterium]|jgi:hypothetical protein|nr:DUF5677 domain-containing protein [Thermoguttaceae bacterium]
MDVRFPGEANHLAEVGSRLSRQFDFAERLLHYWSAAPLDDGFNQSELPPIVIKVLAAMRVRSCRLCRSAIELCKRAEALDAAILARALFDTALIVKFVLKPEFVPPKVSRKDPVRELPSNPLTRKQRATLYLAHNAFKRATIIAKHSRDSGSSHFAARLDEEKREYADAIGPEWTIILQHHPKSYSGLTSRQLADVLGPPFPRWYDSVYGYLCSHVHVDDIEYYLTVDGQGDSRVSWHNSTDEVALSLRPVFPMFHLIAGMMHEHVDFGPEVGSILNGFAVEYRPLDDSE